MPSKSNLTEFEELYMEVHRKVSTEWKDRLDQHISRSQAMILWRLEESGPQKVTSLADNLCITPGAVTSLSDKLIASGYAIRERDTEDRRIVNLQITDEGRHILRQLRIEIKSAVQDLFAGLLDEDIEHLIRIYKQVLINLKKDKEIEKDI